MSYILEAIKKADLKRKIGNVPDIHSDHDIDLDEPKRPIWPYLLAIVLFVNAAVILWWLKPWVEKPPEPSQQEAVIQLEEQDGAVPALVKPQDIDMTGPEIFPGAPMEEMAPSEPPVPALPMATTPEPAPTSANATSKEALKNLPAATLTERIGAVSHELSQKSDEKALPTPSPAPVSINPDPKKTAAPLMPAEALTPAPNNMPESPASQNSIPELKQLAAKPASEAFDNPDDNETSLDDNETIVDGTDDSEQDLTDPEISQEPGRAVFDVKKIPFFYQLPDAVKEKIPEINISFHSYKYRPSARLVRINGRIMREGQAINDDLILEKIVPSGVVILFDHKRFRVGL